MKTKTRYDKDSSGVKIEDSLTGEQKEIIEIYLDTNDIDNEYFKAEDLPNEIYREIKKLSNKKNVYDVVNNYIYDWIMTNRKKRGKKHEQ